MKKIGFIGMGNMAQALTAGFVASKKVKGTDICAYAPDQEKLSKNCQNLGICPCSSLAKMAEKSDTIFIACKPYQVEEIVKGLGNILENIIYDGFDSASKTVTAKYLPQNPKKTDYTVD